MKKNLGSADRIIRIAIALLVAVLYMTGVINGVTAIVLGAVAVIFAINWVLLAFVRSTESSDGVQSIAKVAEKHS